MKCKNQVILLIITDAKKWYCLAAKRLSALLKRITSKHDGDFYCLNCFCSYSTKDKLTKYENLCKNCDYCYTEMAKEKDKITQKSLWKCHLLFIMIKNQIIIEVKIVWTTFKRI